MVAKAILGFRSNLSFEMVQFVSFEFSVLGSYFNNAFNVLDVHGVNVPLHVLCMDLVRL